MSSRSPIGADEIGGLTESVTPLGELRTLPFHPARLDPPLHGLDGFYAARLVRRLLAAALDLGRVQAALFLL